MQCEAIIDARNVMWHGHTVPGAGGQCTRRATYTNGKRCYCTQHAKTAATVLRKATNKIMDGFQRIEANEHVA